MNRQELIVQEAKRRCIAGGYTLETPARALTSMGDRDGPLWQAFVPRVAAEIERIEQAGFSVTPATLADRIDIDDTPPLSARFLAGVAIASVLMFLLFIRWGN